MITGSGTMTLLQREEVRLGREEELSEEAIALYADPRLNYLQMNRLRTALREGMEPDVLRPAAKPWIPVWHMEELIEELKAGNTPEIPRRPFPVRRVLVIAAALLLVLPLPLLAEPEEEPVLELTAPEVRLACGMKFNPASYVRNAEQYGTELILPDAFTAERPETRLVQYQLKGKGGEIRKNLRIRFVDETAPDLKLTTEKTELLKETPFSCQSYVFSAVDAVDGDLKADVHCSDELQDQETQTVEYTVKDRAGNTARTMLTVHFADYGETIGSFDPEIPAPAPAPVYHPAPAAVTPVPQPAPAEIEPLLS